MQSETPCDTLYTGGNATRLVASPGYSLIKGQAELIVNGADHWAEVRRITERYIAAAEVDAYIEPWSMLDTMCVIHPEKFISWERGY